MIIQQAKIAIEDRQQKSAFNACPFWRYLAFRLERTSQIVRIVFEDNTAYYLSYARQWSIDGNVTTGVEDKFVPGEMLHTDCGNGKSPLESISSISQMNYVR